MKPKEFSRCLSPRFCLAGRGGRASVWSSGRLLSCGLCIRSAFRKRGCASARVLIPLPEKLPWAPRRWKLVGERRKPNPPFHIANLSPTERFTPGNGRPAFGSRQSPLCVRAPPPSAVITVPSSPTSLASPPCPWCWVEGPGGTVVSGYACGCRNVSTGHLIDSRNQIQWN